MVLSYLNCCNVQHTVKSTLYIDFNLLLKGPFIKSFLLRFHHPQLSILNLNLTTLPYHRIYYIISILILLSFNLNVNKFTYYILLISITIVYNKNSLSNIIKTMQFYKLYFIVNLILKYSIVLKSTIKIRVLYLYNQIY